MASGGCLGLRLLMKSFDGTHVANCAQSRRGLYDEKVWVGRDGDAIMSMTFWEPKSG